MKHDPDIHYDVFGNVIKEGDLVLMSSPYSSTFEVVLIIHFSDCGLYGRSLTGYWFRPMMALSQWESKLTTVLVSLRKAINEKYGMKGRSYRSNKRWGHSTAMNERLLKLEPEDHEFTNLPEYKEIRELLGFEDAEEIELVL